MRYRSAYNLAWNRILSRAPDLSSSEHLRALFPDNDYHLEEYQFSRLHSIMLDPTPGNLEEVLADPNIDINATDNRGGTALTWAVNRQDYVSTRLLLHHGADPNIVSCFGDAPIAFAAYGHYTAGIRLLLNFGASLTGRSLVGKSCLHYACGNIIVCDILEVLIAAGCNNVHEKNREGSTPLNLASQYSSCAALSTLINHGSDINTIDLEGDCPLLNSLSGFKDDNTRLLLDLGADSTIINIYGCSILHNAALSGGLTTLEILRSAKLSRIDPNAKDKEGNTSLQLAQKPLPSQKASSIYS